MRAALLAVALLAAAAVPASASQLLYSCGADFADMCSALPDGQGQRVVERDAGAPALSRDGRHVAFVRSSDLYVDGRRAMYQNRPLLVRFGPAGRFAVGEVGAVLRSTAVCSYNTDLSGNNEGRYCLASGVSSGLDYLPNGRIVMAGSGGTSTQGRSVISLLRPEDGQGTGVERRLLEDPALNLESPAVSPDGRFAVVVRTADGVRGELALYDLASGALVRSLTTGPSDAAPSFSPDGTAVAFDRDGAIWTVPVRGGRARRVVAHGRSPSWGGGGVTIGSLPDRVGPGRLRSGLRATVTGLRRGVALRAVLRGGGGVLARGGTTVRGSRGAIELRVPSDAVARLGRRARLTLRISVRGAGVPRVTLRATLAFRR